MEQKTISRPVDLKHIQVTDPFWKGEMELVRTEVIPYQWETLNDRVEGAAPSYCMHNFKAAGRLNEERKEQGSSFEEPKYTFRGFEALPEDPEHPEPDKFYGFVFQDSDFSKWIEAVAYSLTQHPDPKLEAVADQAIDIVCAAQQPNGYLDTYYIINGMDRIFTNLKDHHELYCFGHLTEGAVAYYQATGKDKLLKAAMRFAEFIDSKFGPEEGKCKGYPGHEIAEMALVRLYEATGEARFLRLAEFFINQRGTQPYYFDQEHELTPIEKRQKIRYKYNQAHLPVREQERAVGHAVRAVYLYSGMADVARLTGDESLKEACRNLWNSVVKEQMYVTGGIGSTRLGEAFSFPFDLPNDTVYAETCASIGLVFFARRMLEMEADSQYADVMELALHNGILSGMALDGKSFFYVNPLSVNPEACREDERKNHVKPVRQKWFGCACCPPNLARLVSSVGSYAFTENADTLFVHLYLGGTIAREADGKQFTVSLTSEFPWNGQTSVRVSCKEPVTTTIAFRIPGWSEDFEMTGAQGKDCRMEKGYLYVSGEWKDGDELKLNFPMTVRILQADSRVREDIGKLAVMRGPVVYCLEEADNGTHLERLYLKGTASFCEEISTELGTPMVMLETTGRRRLAEEYSDGLYHTWQKAKYEEAKLRMIPYYAWANRGEGEMQVWIEEDR
mgnify:CR=1 FL=1